MSDFVARRPVWSLVIIFAVGILAWLIFSVWTPGLEAMLGRKRVFLSALFNGITLGALYFLVASGFTLIFGLMRNVNLAHGSLYLFGGYLGYSVGNLTGSWLLALLAAFNSAASTLGAPQRTDSATEVTSGRSVAVSAPGTPTIQSETPSPLAR